MMSIEILFQKCSSLLAVQFLDTLRSAASDALFNGFERRSSTEPYLVFPLTMLAPGEPYPGEEPALCVGQRVPAALDNHWAGCADIAHDLTRVFVGHYVVGPGQVIVVLALCVFHPAGKWVFRHGTEGSQCMTFTLVDTPG